jgi:hypothetical protein
MKQHHRYESTCQDEVFRAALSGQKDQHNTHISVCVPVHTCVCVGVDVSVVCVCVWVCVYVCVCVHPDKGMKIR